MRSAWSAAAEFSIVVAIVAVGAQDSGAHAAPQRPAIKIQHVRTEAGLRERAAAIVEHRMTRGGKRAEFRNNIQTVAGRNHSKG